MILKSLALTNVGVYADEQRIDFAPPSQEQPVTLIGGLNGAGKTTLMRSLFHVLYGAHALPLIERRGSYDRYLEDITRSEVDQASVELTFTVQRNHENEEITVRRTWRRRGGSIKEETEAFRNGSFDQSLSDGWLDFIESIVPRGIARLVFFDGEKVEALADLENASATLRTAVGSLLGLDLVDQLVIDLDVLQRRRAVQGASPEEQQHVKALEQDVLDAKELHATREEEAAREEETVHAAAEVLNAAEEAFRVAGGDFYERRSALLQETENAQANLATAEMNARALAVMETAPLLLLRPAVTTLADLATRDEDGAKLLAARDVVTERDQFVTSVLEELDAPEELRTQLEQRLSQDRAELDARVTELPSDLGLAASAPLLSELATTDLDSLGARRDEAVTDIEEARADLDRLERLAAQVPTEESIRALEQRRSDAADNVAAARARADAAASARDEAQRALDRARAERERYARRLADAQLERLDSERLVEHADRARQTLSKLRIRAAAENVDRISDLTVEALEQLLRKDRLISEVSIDPASFTPEFKDRDGHVIHPDQLSAGERQLTALALLWALARASGRPLPVLIDTPLGRLDSAHRHHVVTRYLPLAGQQVIVLSTDTEIEAQLLDDLEPHVGASYELAFDDDAHATTIEPGYIQLGTPA